MEVIAGFYPTKDVGHHSDRIEFYYNGGLKLYALCHGSKLGDPKWATRFILDRIELYLLEHKDQIVTYNAHPSPEGLTGIGDLLKNAINKSDELFYSGVNNRIDERSHSFVTLDLLLILNGHAYICHVGHNQLAHVANGIVLAQTKIYSKYQQIEKKEELDKELIEHLIDSPTSRIGLRHIEKLIIQPIPLVGNDIFLMYTPKFYQSFKLPLGKLDSKIFNLLDKKPPADASHELYRIANERKPDPTIGVFVVKIKSEESTSAINELRTTLDKKFEVLKSLSMFSEIKDDRNSLNTIYSLTEPRTFHKGAQIIKQGDPSNEFYIILSGSVTVYMDNEELFRLNKGRPIGEVSVICDEPYFSTAIADVDVVAIAIKKTLLFKHLRENPSLALKVKSGLLIEAIEKNKTQSREIKLLRQNMLKVLNKPTL